jgi:hypothetical protein
MMHTLWNFQLLLVSPSTRSNRDHFLQADFPVPIYLEGKTPASLVKLASYLEVFTLSVRPGKLASPRRHGPGTSGRARAQSFASGDPPRRSRHRSDRTY